MFRFIQKNKIVLSALGAIVGFYLILSKTSNFEKEIIKSIAIKKDKIAVFHSFFTEKNLIAWFGNAKEVKIEGGHGAGGAFVVQIGNEEIRYAITKFKKPELIIFKSPYSKQKLKFISSAIGTVVNVTYKIRGSFSFFYSLIYRNKIDKNLTKALILLKESVEKE